MLKVKHFADAVEPDDGQRLWVEPISLTRDLREWCVVHGALAHLAPPRSLWAWFERHATCGGAADAYDYFRGMDHDHLTNGPYGEIFRAIAWRSIDANYTLIHQGEDPRHNTGTALYEFLAELQSYCPPQA